MILIIDSPVLCHEMQICLQQVRSLYPVPARQLPRANLERLARPEINKFIDHCHSFPGDKGNKIGRPYKIYLKFACPGPA